MDWTNYGPITEAYARQTADALAGFLQRLAGRCEDHGLFTYGGAFSCNACWDANAPARALSPNAGHVPLKPLDLRELQEQLRPFVETLKAGRKEKEARMAFHTAYGSLPDPPAHAQTLDELRLERGNRVQELLDSEAPSTLALLYKALYARGMRVGGVDQDIEKALRKELGKD